VDHASSAEDEQRLDALDVKDAGGRAVGAPGKEKRGDQRERDPVRRVTCREPVQEKRRRRMKERLQDDQIRRRVEQPAEGRQQHQRRHDVLGEERVTEHRHVRHRPARRGGPQRVIEYREIESVGAERSV
jgi:hypothetical protein